MRSRAGTVPRLALLFGLLVLTAVAVLGSHALGAGASPASALMPPTASVAPGSAGTATPGDAACSPQENGHVVQIDCLAAPTWQGDLGPDAAPAEHSGVSAAAPSSPPSAGRDPRAPTGVPAPPVLRI